MPPTPPDQSSTPTRRAAEGLWLAIECSGLHGSIALGEVTREGVTVVAAEPLPRDARSARTLAPAIERIVAGQGGSVEKLTAVAVTAGPGSFTGLRVGVVTAKTLAYALGIGVIGVDTLDALAGDLGAPPAGLEKPAAWTVLDAQRGELFAARFVRDGAAWKRDTATGRTIVADLLDRAAPDDAFRGPLDPPPEPLAACDFALASPTAEGVLYAAHAGWLAGAQPDPFVLIPAYHRLSAAEEKAAEIAAKTK